MKRARQTKQLLRQLGTAPALVEDPERTDGRRAKVVGRLDELLQSESARRTQRARWSRPITLLAVAAMVAVVFGGWLVLSRQPSPTAAQPVAMLPHVTALAGVVEVSRGGQRRSTVASVPLPLTLSDEVRTGPAGQARISLESGAIVAVAPDTRLQLSPDPRAVIRRYERLELQSGRVDLAVPKLGPDQSLAVGTPHARVVVRGTTFSVEVRPSQNDHGLATHVSVTEGLVVVHAGGQDTLLGPGAHWSSEAQHLGRRAGAEGREGSEADSSAMGGASAAPPASSTQVAGRAVGSAKTDRPDPAASTLAQENRLYSKALAARRRGDDPAVVSHLDELIRRYPRSTLLPEARLERSRALKRLGRASSAAGGARG